MKYRHEWQSRLVYGVIVMTVAGLIFSGCPTVQAQTRLTPVMASSVSTSWTVTLGPAVAQQKGYWRQENLDVKLSVVSPSTAHTAAFAGGSFQFTINLNADVMVRAAAAGANIYAITGSSNQNQYVLFAKQGIKTLADLKGKKIAIDTPGGSHDVFAQKALSTVGMSVRDVLLVPVAGTIEVRVNALLAGATDAAIGSISQWPTLRDKGMNLVYRIRDVYPDWQTAVNGVHGDFLQKDPVAVKGFIKGMIRAFQFMKDPRNEAELLKIAKDAKITVDEQRWGESLKIQNDFWPNDGGMNLKGMELVLSDERKDGRIPKDYKLEQFIRLKPLEEAQRELGLRP